jgi:hypothetical protein
MQWPPAREAETYITRELRNDVSSFHLILDGKMRAVSASHFTELGVNVMQQEVNRCSLIKSNRIRFLSMWNALSSKKQVQILYGYTEASRLPDNLIEHFTYSMTTTKLSD